MVIANAGNHGVSRLSLEPFQQRRIAAGPVGVTPISSIGCFNSDVMDVAL